MACNGGRAVLASFRAQNSRTDEIFHALERSYLRTVACGEYHLMATTDKPLRACPNSLEKRKSQYYGQVEMTVREDGAGRALQVVRVG